MDRLHAPWRSEYVKNPDGEGCVFCKARDEKEENESYVIVRGKYSFVILNIYPYNNGHVMIAPFRHTGDLQELNEKEILEMMLFTRRMEEVLRESMNAQGFNIGMNIGRIAGAGFVNHLHIHVVPRWSGDTNFMPILGETKVLPMSLDEALTIIKETYERKFGN